MAVDPELTYFDLEVNDLPFALDLFGTSSEGSNDAPTSTTSPGTSAYDSSDPNSPLDLELVGESNPQNVFDQYLSLGGETEGINVAQQFAPWPDQSSALKILIEPKAAFRMRFRSEIDPDNHRPNRFIPGDAPTEKTSYPTVEIPSWIDQSRSWYVRVTLLTVTKSQTNDYYIHPYSISASEPDVIEVPEENSLYFPITRNDIASGKKNFQLLLIQPVQRDLQRHGAMRLFSSNEIDPHQMTDTQNVKRFIQTYELWKCQLAFTLTKRQHSEPSMGWETIQPPVFSRPMMDEKKNLLERNPRSSNSPNLNQITCIPAESEWHGNTSVVLIFPYIIKKKSYRVYVDFGSNSHSEVLNARIVDTKTMLIQTPLCPVPWSSVEKLPVSLHVEQDNVLLPPIPFSYVQPPRNICSRCQGASAVPTNPGKRPRRNLEVEEDGGEILFKSFNKLAIKEEKIEPSGEEEEPESSPRRTQERTTQTSASETPTTTSNASAAAKYKELNTKFESYLNKLKDAVSKFVRTENPSLLFRRTRQLLLQTEEASPPVHDAIQAGHVKLVEKLLEQTFDLAKGEGLLDQKNSQGRTPLLVSAQYNHWSLIELILRQREDFAEQVDNKKNNFLHILAEHQHTETIRLSLPILSTSLKQKLLNEKNQFDQRPVDIAQVHEQTEAVELLTSKKDDEQV